MSAAAAGVLLVAQQQPVHHRAAELADADLERPAIAQQAAHVQADGMLDRADGAVRRSEQIVVVARVVDEKVELLRLDLRVSRHERHLRMALAHHHDVAAGTPCLGYERQQIDADIGVRAETQLQLAVHHAPREQLGNHVHAARERIAGDVRVVGAQVIALRVPGVQEGAGREEELHDAYVGRQAIGAQVARILRLDVAAEHPRDQRIEQARLERRARHGLEQRQRGEDGEVQARIAPRAPVELVDQGVGFADAERQRQHHARSHTAQHRVNAVADVSECLGHATCGMLTEGRGVRQPRRSQEE